MKIIIIFVSPLCHFAAATDVHHDKSEAEIGNTTYASQPQTIICSCKCIYMSTPFPLPAYTAESDVYKDNEDSKLNKRSESQKGELHMNFTILSYYNNFMFKRGDGPNQRSQEPRRTQNEKVSQLI